MVGIGTKSGLWVVLLMTIKVLLVEQFRAGPMGRGDPQPWMLEAIAGRIDALLVIGAPNSSNSRRLVEVGRAAGCDYAQLVMRADQIDWRAMQGIRSVGGTAGASAPEVLVNEVIDAFRARYDVTVELVETALFENERLTGVHPA